MSEKFTKEQLDILKELINIGGGNAATSIAQMIETRVHMDLPTLEKMNYEEIFTEIMPEEQIVKAVIVRVGGSLEGMFLFVIENEEIEILLEKLLKKEISDKELCDSAIREFVNILVNSYLNALSTFMNQRFYSSVPLVVEDMFGALLSSAYLEEEQYEEEFYIIKNEFLLNGNKLESSLYFVPKVGILEKFLSEMTN